MSSATLKQLTALSADEYEAVIVRDGREYTRRFRVWWFKGREVVSDIAMALDADSLSNAPAIAAAVQAFHHAHQPEDLSKYDVDMEITEHGKAAIAESMDSYYKKHPEAIPADNSNDE